MLTEDNVVLAVCRKLETEAYTIRQRLNTKQRGEDIIALKGQVYLSIEAKGSTSSKNNTQRYGYPFSTKQIQSHVARAFYKACIILFSPSTHRLEGELKAGIALPDTEHHRQAVRAIKPIIMELQIVIFWVKSIDDVEVESIWSL